MNELPGLGWMPDPPETVNPDTGFRVVHADYPASELPVTAPDATSHSNAGYIDDVLQQGRLGSCTANAGAQVLRAATYKLMKESGVEISSETRPEIPSRLFFYHLCLASRGPVVADLGSWLRIFFEMANRHGWPDESVWSYDDRLTTQEDGRAPKYQRLPSTAAFRAAFDRRSTAPHNKLVEYRRIFERGYERVEAIKRFSREGYLIAFGTDVDERFCRQPWDGKPITPPLSRFGGHAMVVEGYTQNTCRILNSWGLGWGDQGRCDFTWDYMADDRTSDLWIAKRVPLLLGAG